MREGNPVLIGPAEKRSRSEQGLVSKGSRTRGCTWTDSRHEWLSSPSVLISPRTGERAEADRVVNRQSDLDFHVNTRAILLAVCSPGPSDGAAESLLCQNTSTVLKEPLYGIRGERARSPWPR